MAVIYLNDEDQDFLIFHMKLEADCGKEADAVIANRIINKIINSCIKDTPRCLKTIDMEIQNDIHE